MRPLSIKKNKNLSRRFFKSGFTLIEMMVSVAIFTMVMVVAAGAILSITAANRKSQAIKVAIGSLSFALENMSRHIRVGTEYSLVGSSEFRFKFKDPTAPSEQPYSITYRRVVDTTSGNGSIVIDDGSDGSTGGPLTGADINIESLTFYVEGSSTSDSVQPRVIIAVKGFVGGGDEKSKTEFNLHTSVTQRLLDVPAP